MDAIAPIFASPHAADVISWAVWCSTCSSFSSSVEADPLPCLRRSDRVSPDDAYLFSIGIFPWLMVAATAIFFEPRTLRRLLERLMFRPSSIAATATPPIVASVPRVLAAIALVYLILQITIPFRHWCYPGNVNWTEQGHRFSWRMKLRTKDGWVSFLVRDPKTGQVWTVDQDDFLDERQQRKMAGVPDMIHQFAQYLAQRWRERGHDGVRVEVRAFTSLNGRKHQLLIDPKVDLSSEPRSLLPASWILPLIEPLRR